MDLQVLSSEKRAFGVGNPAVADNEMWARGGGGGGSDAGAAKGAWTTRAQTQPNSSAFPLTSGCWWSSDAGLADEGVLLVGTLVSSKPWSIPPGVSLFSDAQVVDAPTYAEVLRLNNFAHARNLVSHLTRQRTGDEPFDGRAIHTALSVLDSAKSEGLEAPSVAWNGSEAVLLIWQRRGRADIVTITDGEASLLKNDEYQPQLTSIPVNERKRVRELLSNILA